MSGFCWCCKMDSPPPQQRSLPANKGKPPSSGAPVAAFKKSSAASTTATQSDVRAWAESLENLLGSSAGRAHFRKFLEVEETSRWLSFWESCQDLQSCSNSQVSSRCQAILERFFAVTATDELDLEENVRNQVMSRRHDRSRDMFQPALRKAVEEMKRDLYPRFISSNEYRKLVQ